MLLFSALALLVAGVLADHVDLAPASDDLAVLAYPLDAGSDLHRALDSLSVRRIITGGDPTRDRCHPSRFRPN